MSDYLDPNNEELLKDFFIEAQTMVETLEQNILVLESDPGNNDSVDEIFRAAHTLKGAAATVQMTELSGFTHVVEDLLDEIRSGKIKVTGDVVDSLLDSIDIVKNMLEERAQGGVYSADVSSVKNQLQAILVGKAESVEPDDKPVDEEDVPKKISSSPSSSGLTEYDILELKEAAPADCEIYRVKVFFNEENPMNSVGGIQVFAALKDTGSVLRTDPDFESLYKDVFHPEVSYFLASEQSTDVFERKLNIPEVVVSHEICGIDELSDEDSEEDPGTKTGKKEQSPVKKKQKSKEKTVSSGQQNTETGKKSAVIQEAPISSLDSKMEKLEKASPPEMKKVKKVSSVLRVDSTRIDTLLNLVSEAVINKATFNQISNQFSDTLLNFQNTGTSMKEVVKELFDSLPEYLEGIQEGKSVKEIKKEMLERFGGLYSMYDSFEGTLKSTINKFKGTAQNLGRLTGDLHEKVLQIRMVPIAQIFSRFPRLVRDVSKSLKKQVNLVIEGEDTELDKSVIEDLLDPLIHCVRNSVDHGIESPEEREAEGKDAGGTVILSARNEGNMIVIEVSDDGKGIDVETVRQKAIDRGIIHPSKNLSDIEAYNLIFEPGFSTAASVTNISGRGVGLDVVRKQIEKLNGNVSVWSEKGTGTRLTIKLPLTLAIIQGLLVKVGNEIYAIPITSVIESHRIKPEEIKMIDNYEVFNVREDVVSLIRLNRLFMISANEEREYHFVVIVGSGDKKMGLMVDSLIGEEDVVIKPLKDRYTNSPGIAGATILGDGTVSLIIDVSQLLDLGFKQELEDRRRREATIR